MSAQHMQELAEQFGETAPQVGDAITHNDVALLVKDVSDEQVVLTDADGNEFYFDREVEETEAPKVKKSYGKLRPERKLLVDNYGFHRVATGIYEMTVEEANVRVTNGESGWFAEELGAGDDEADIQIVEPQATRQLATEAAIKLIETRVAEQAETPVEEPAQA